MTEKTTHTPPAPPGRLFAIGDIHGCRQELATLLAEIHPEPGDTVVFLGDYIDRGPDSKGVLDDLIAYEQACPATVIFLRGNHEDMFLDYLGGLAAVGYGEAFLTNGGRRTLASYGITVPWHGGSYADTARLDLAHGRSLAAKIPPVHLAFLERTRLAYEWGDHLCVHAGINPRRTWDDQDPEDLLWIRGDFINHKHPVEPRTVVFGHTPRLDPLVDRVGGKIGIDTGCVYGRVLTAIELPSGKVTQVHSQQAGPLARAVTQYHPEEVEPWTNSSSND
jgi:serine/threonine protein phosphatase 1